jgi:hypothetical protein
VVKAWVPRIAEIRAVWRGKYGPLDISSLRAKPLFEWLWRSLDGGSASLGGIVPLAFEIVQVVRACLLLYIFLNQKTCVS